eukprot:scpid90127/ scgid21168/ 
MSDIDDDVVEGSQSDGTEDLSVEFRPSGSSHGNVSPSRPPSTEGVPAVAASTMSLAVLPSASSSSSSSSTKRLTGLARLLQGAPAAAQSAQRNRQPSPQPAAVVESIAPHRSLFTTGEELSQWTVSQEGGDSAASDAAALGEDAVDTLDKTDPLSPEAAELAAEDAPSSPAPAAAQAASAELRTVIPPSTHEAVSEPPGVMSPSGPLLPPHLPDRPPLRQGSVVDKDTDMDLMAPPEADMVATPLLNDSSSSLSASRIGGATSAHVAMAMAIRPPSWRRSNSNTSTQPPSVAASATGTAAAAAVTNAPVPAGARAGAEEQGAYETSASGGGGGAGDTPALQSTSSSSDGSVSVRRTNSAVRIQYIRHTSGGSASGTSSGGSLLPRSSTSPSFEDSPQGPILSSSGSDGPVTSTPLLGHRHQSHIGRGGLGAMPSPGAISPHPQAPGRHHRRQDNIGGVQPTTVAGVSMVTMAAATGTTSDHVATPGRVVERAGVTSSTRSLLGVVRSPGEMSESSVSAISPTQPREGTSAMLSPGPAAISSTHGDKGNTDVGESSTSVISPTPLQQVPATAAPSVSVVRGQAVSAMSSSSASAVQQPMAVPSSGSSVPASHRASSQTQVEMSTSTGTSSSLGDARPPYSKDQLEGNLGTTAADHASPLPVSTVTGAGSIATGPGMASVVAAQPMAGPETREQMLERRRRAQRERLGQRNIVLVEDSAQSGFQCLVPSQDRSEDAPDVIPPSPGSIPLGEVESDDDSDTSQEFAVLETTSSDEPVRLATAVSLPTSGGSAGHHVQAATRRAVAASRVAAASLTSEDSIELPAWQRDEAMDESESVSLRQPTPPQPESMLTDQQQQQPTFIASSQASLDYAMVHSEAGGGGGDSVRDDDDIAIGGGGAGDAADSRVASSQPPPTSVQHVIPSSQPECDNAPLSATGDAASQSAVASQQHVGSVAHSQEVRSSQAASVGHGSQRVPPSSSQSSQKAVGDDDDDVTSSQPHGSQQHLSQSSVQSRLSQPAGSQPRRSQ